ncbi:7328_t:CDS:2 [Cetraspora pellucida]|uniref:7328_t:CDS:1 n=1 Tax=Cetraspora pellucida TaxID=1433469 RepID=A0A9N9IND9_9GLOM|nr:7328_t:CDS:2 [Cetraspora pellucida]
MQKIEAALNLLAVDHLSIRLLYPNINEQQNLKDIIILLKPIETAMKLLLATSYPTIGDIRLVFLEEYWVIMNKSFIVSTVLDPCAKLKFFDKTEAISAKKKLCNKLETEESSVSNYLDDKALEEPSVTNELDRYVVLETVEEDTIPLDW